MSPDIAEVVLRLLLACLLGAAVGFERDMHGHLAGMRTHALVATGAALFTLVGAYGFSDVHRGPNVDPMRVAAQIVSGIGFIGAGAIMRDGGSVRGITTAAALWASAAVGMACGAGEYGAAAAGLFVVLLALVGLRVLRDRGLPFLTPRRNAVDVSYERGHGTLSPIVDAIERAGATVEGLRIDDDEETRHLHLRVRGGREEDLRRHVEAIARRPEISQVRVARHT